MSSFVTVITRNAPFAALASPREAIRQFTPNWFAVTMGTGILSLALAQLPGNLAVLRAAGEALWFLNIGLFVLFSVMYASRWLMFFDEARQVFGHSTVSMFFGTIPMGLATLTSRPLCNRAACRGLVVAGCGDGHGLRCVDPVHDVHPPGTQHREDDRCVAIACGRSGSRRRLRGIADNASGRRGFSVHRADHQLCAVGLFGARRVEHSGHPAVASGAAQTAPREHGGVELAGTRPIGTGALGMLGHGQRRPGDLCRAWGIGRDGRHAGSGAWVCGGWRWRC